VLSLAFVTRTIYVVLPAYDEERNVGGLLTSIETALTAASLSFRAIVVDDGSGDGTGRVLAERAAAMPELVVVTHPVNLGLGPTIRDGLAEAVRLASPEDVVVSMDADETHTPDLIPAMLAKIDAGADVVVASRYRPGSKVVGLARHRELMSLGASWLFRAGFPTAGLRDYTCGYRAYRAAALRAAFDAYGDALVDQAGFQCMVDIVLKMRRLPIRFAEVPMVLRYDFKRGASKMRVLRTALATGRLLLKRRFERHPVPAGAGTGRR